MLFKMKIILKQTKICTLRLLLSLKKELKRGKKHTKYF